MRTHHRWVQTALAVAAPLVLLLQPGFVVGQTAPYDPNAALAIGAGDLNPVLDPQIEVSANGDTYKRAVFDALTYIDAHGTLQPALAASWKNSSPTRWEFKLRPGVKFSNGDPLRAQDVVFAIKRILDPATKSVVRARIPTVTEAAAPDDATVQITTSHPDPILPRRLSVIYIIDSASFQKNHDFVGTGPFRVETFQKDQRLVLDRVAGSWRGTPGFAKVTMLGMPEVSARINALRAGQVDVILALPADQIAPLNAAGYGVVHGLAGRTCNVILNTRHGGPLANRLVRQAMNYAVDKSAIVKDIYHDTAALAQGQLVGPDGFGYDPRLKAYPYDPLKAQALLKEAGYAGGFTEPFVGSEGYFDNDSVLEQAISGMLAKVGIKTPLAIENSALWHANNNNGRHTTMLFTCIQYFPVMDADFVLQLFQSTHPYQWYDNHAFDAMLDQSRGTLDTTKRLALLHRAAEILYEDAPVIFLYQEPVIIGFNRSVSGIEARPDEVLWLDSMKKAR